ncbi:MAG: xanthine dehydrogenase family protein subunit M [Bryobacteraceae bacterium]
MIPLNFDYSAPSSLDEALHLLSSGAKPLSGGMSLIPMMKLRLAAPERVVDLGRIAGLNTIAQDGGVIRVGAMATHHEVESAALLRRSCPLLAEVAGQIGDVQVRNRGTIGGSVAHADPAADYPAALFALEARVRLVKTRGDRTLDIGEFIQDTFTTAADGGEIVREVIVPAEDAGTGTAYAKMLQPASGFAIVGVAARIRKVGGAITMARIGVTGLGSKAYRATGVEAALQGKAGTADDIAAAVAGIGDGVDANSDIHASADYRQHMARVYATRAIQKALSRIA